VKNGVLVMRTLLHIVIVTYGILSMCLAGDYLLGRVLGANQRYADYVFFGPTFAVPIALGCWVGYRFGIRLPRWVSWLLFVPSLLLMCHEIATEYRYRIPDQHFLSHLFDNYFGRHCEASECLNELLITAPLLSSFAYSLGAEFRRMLFRITVRSLPKP
jgi:hypothetical protein